VEANILSTISNKNEIISNKEMTAGNHFKSKLQLKNP